jgi:hypothetical protein
VALKVCYCVQFVPELQSFWEVVIGSNIHRSPQWKGSDVTGYPNRFKIELVFADRADIVADLSVTFARHRLNIVSMEVVRREDRAHLSFEARKQSCAY